MSTTKTEECVDYGVHKNGMPRRTPIRLLTAVESLIYWFILVVPLVWIFGDHFRPLFYDGGKWFDYKLLLTVCGWLPFGIVGNWMIRGFNKVLLRTDWARKSKLRGGISGARRAAKAGPGYVHVEGQTDITPPKTRTGAKPKS